MKLMRNQNPICIDFFQFKGMIESNPKACPSNIDMIFERRGKFLIGEWKRELEQLSKGQEILLKALARQDNFFVLLICGDTDGDETLVSKFWWVTKNGRFKQGGSTFDELRNFVTRWYNWADKGE